MTSILSKSPGIVLSRKAAADLQAHVGSTVILPAPAGRTGRGADRGDGSDGQRHPSQADARASASGVGPGAGRPVAAW